MTAPTVRLAYIRTLLQPDKSHDDILSMLNRFMKQKDPEILDGKPKHRFLFGASTTSDKHILDIFLSFRLPLDPIGSWNFSETFKGLTWSATSRELMPRHRKVKG